MSRLEDLIFEIGEFESIDPQLCRMVYDLATVFRDELYSIRAFCELTRDGVAQRMDRVEADTVDRVVEDGGPHPLQGQKRPKNRGPEKDRTTAEIMLADKGIEFTCHDRHGSHLMIHRGGKRWDFWPSTGRWGRNGKKTCVSGIRKLIEDVLKVQSLLPKSCDGKFYKFPDGSSIRKVEYGGDGWRASWNDGVSVMGEDPRTGREVDWIFDTAEHAAVALMEAGEGPGGEKR